MNPKTLCAEPPSEMFMDAVCDGGTPVADCALCGRVHYDADGEYMDEGELEDIEKKRAASPEKYIPHWCTSVSIGEIDGRQVVWGCECNGMRRFEDFIWEHRFLIAQYLAKRAESQLDEAQRDKKCADNIAVAASATS